MDRSGEVLMTRLLLLALLGGMAMGVVGCEARPGPEDIYRYDDPDYNVTCWALDTGNLAGGISCIANPPRREK